MKVYLIMGHRGEYSDRYDYPLKAFKDLEKAKKFQISANFFSSEHYKKQELEPTWDPVSCPFDENFQSSNGFESQITEYSIHEIELEND